MRYEPLIWPFLVSLALTSALAVYAAGRRLRGSLGFALLMAALSVWTFCYVMELSTVSLAGKTFWLRAKYLGSATGPILWLVFSVLVTNRGRWLRRPLFWAPLAAWLAATWVVVFTPLRRWMWPEITLVPGFPETQAVHGPFFWFYAAGMYALVLGSVALYFSHYHATPGFFRRQAALLVLGGFVPLAGRMTQDLLGMDLIPRVDEVIFFFLFSGILFALALFRYGALSLVPIAHSLVVRDIQAAILVLDPQGRVVELNPCAQALLGAPGAIGRTLHALRPDWPELSAADTAEVCLPHDGGPAWFSVHRSTIDPRGGGAAGQAIVLFDVTARKNAEQQLEVLARSDPLTGVTNRRHFFELAEAEVARATRYGRPLAVLMLDVDHFKAINDRHGHLDGDRVLKLVAAECQLGLRGTDVFARYGGEEFVALLPETDRESALATAERIRQVVEAAALDTPGGPLRVTVSLGLAHRPAAGGATLDQLIHQADEALYASKAAGRNRVTVAAAPDAQLLAPVQG